MKIHDKGILISVTHMSHEVDKGPGTVRNSFYGHEEPIYGIDSSIDATNDIERWFYYIYTINKLKKVSLFAAYLQTLLVTNYFAAFAFASLISCKDSPRALMIFSTSPRRGSTTDTPIWPILKYLSDKEHDVRTHSTPPKKVW